MLSFLKKRRREQLRRTPLPADWLPIIQRNVPYHDWLPERDQQDLHGLVQVFLGEKNFEGCAGLVITDEIRVTIAATACLLLLRRETDVFPGLLSILVYPEAYIARRRHQEGEGIVTEEDEEFLGESWAEGSLVLSWSDILADAQAVQNGNNVILHEFAHQLDEETGAADGAPVLPDPGMYPAWAEVLGREFRALQRAVDRNQPTLLDEYGAESPAEFFAVATEAFFSWPGDLKSQHPELYEQLQLYYNQDPASWPGAPAAADEADM